MQLARWPRGVPIGQRAVNPWLTEEMRSWSGCGLDGTKPVVSLLQTFPACEMREGGELFQGVDNATLNRKPGRNGRPAR